MNTFSKISIVNFLLCELATLFVVHAHPEKQFKDWLHPPVDCPTPCHSEHCVLSFSSNGQSYSFFMGIVCTICTIRWLYVSRLIIIHSLNTQHIQPSRNAQEWVACTFYYQEGISIPWHAGVFLMCRCVHDVQVCSWRAGVFLTCRCVLDVQVCSWRAGVFLTCRCVLDVQVCSWRAGVFLTCRCVVDVQVCSWRAGVFLMCRCVLEFLASCSGVP